MQSTSANRTPHQLAFSQHIDLEFRHVLPLILLGTFTPEKPLNSFNGLTVTMSNQASLAVIFSSRNDLFTGYG